MEFFLQSSSSQYIRGNSFLWSRVWPTRPIFHGGKARRQDWDVCHLDKGWYENFEARRSVQKQKNNHEIFLIFSSEFSTKLYYINFFRIIEINGTMVVSKGVNRVEEFWSDDESSHGDEISQDLEIGSHPLRIVVVRTPPPPPPPRAPTRELNVRNDNKFSLFNWVTKYSFFSLFKNNCRLWKRSWHWLLPSLSKSLWRSERSKRSTRSRWRSIRLGRMKRKKFEMTQTRWRKSEIIWELNLSD